jgi:hypothetical protein
LKVQLLKAMGFLGVERSKAMKKVGQGKSEVKENESKARRLSPFASLVRRQT